MSAVFEGKANAARSRKSGVISGTCMAEPCGRGGTAREEDELFGNQTRPLVPRKARSEPQTLPTGNRDCPATVHLLGNLSLRRTVSVSRCDLSTGCADP